MKNNKYWRERFKQIEAVQHQDSIAFYQAIESQYYKAQRSIEGKISTWYQRLADNNGVSLLEAKKMLTGKELEEFQWDVWEYIKHGKENAVSNEWMKQLENASARFHISRLESLRIQVQQSMEELFGNQLDNVDKYMKHIYTDRYYHTAFEIQKGLRIGWDISSIDSRRLEKIISKPWAADGRNFSGRIWHSKTKLVNELHTELTQMCMLGSGPDKAINNIARKMKTSKTNAGRLIMTESAYFASVAQKECFEELGLGAGKFEIVATLDTYTSEICREMDGKIFQMAQYNPGTTAPPFHVNCRSTTVPYFEDEFGQTGKRVARGTDGKTYYVPADMKYKDWKRTFVDSEDKKDLQPTVPDASDFEDKKIKDAHESFLEKLERSDGVESVVDKLKEYAHSTDYTKDGNSRAAFMYDTTKDVIVYNPDTPYYEEYDMNFVQSHELAHRMDVLEYHSWENRNFVNAIEKCSKRVYDYVDEIEEWFSIDGKYDLDMALSDIISALSKGGLNEFLCAGHEKEYWGNNPKYICMEIFANMVSIDTMGYDSKAELEDLLEEVYAAYKEMVT